MASGGYGVWRQGDRIVATRDSDLGDACVKCGAPAEGWRWNKTLYWHEPWVYILILPAWGVIGDVLSEVYGFKATRRAIFIAFAMEALAVFTFWLTAVLPPFMDAARPAAPQLALFAVATIGMDVLTMSAYGLGGAALARRMGQPRFRKGFALLTGVLLLAAAVLIVSRL